MKQAQRNEVAAVALTLGGLLLMYLLSREVDNLWHLLSIFYLVMVPASLLLVRVEWKRLFRFEGKHAIYGAVGAGVLYFAGWIGVIVIREVLPGLADDIESMYGVLSSVPGWQMWPLLLWVITGEEIVWRQAVTQPFAQRLKGWAALAGGVAFMVVHTPWAPPVVWVAALVFGTAWSWMAVRWKSFWPPFIAHVAWDVLVMVVARY